MTLRELMLNYVLPAMGEEQSDFSSYAGRYVGVSNIVLSELWELNERLRAHKGLESLGEFTPYAAEDELPLEWELLVNCAIWGIATRLHVDEAGDEGAMVGFFENEYTKGREQFSIARYRTVKNVVR